MAAIKSILNECKTSNLMVTSTFQKSKKEKHGIEYFERYPDVLGCNPVCSRTWSKDSNRNQFNAHSFALENKEYSELYPNFLPSSKSRICHVVKKNRFSHFKLQASSENALDNNYPEKSKETFLNFSNKDVQIPILAIATVLLGVANRILYKMALIPLKNYPFFLAQFTTFGYVIFYFLILLIRCKMNIVTKDMLRLPKYKFAIIGALEALGLAFGMSAAAMLPGGMIPVLSQSFLLWQFLLSYFFLGKKFSWGQILGFVCILMGVILVVFSGKSLSVIESGNFWSMVLIISTLFGAADVIFKEYLFQDAKTRLNGKDLDIFVVNSFGSGFQALFVFFLLPVLSQVRGIPFLQLPNYFKEGAACFLNVGGNIAGCEYSPLLPLTYVFTNLAFNICALYLLRISSALLLSFASTLSVPLSIALFTLPLPLLGSPTSLSPNFFLGSTLLSLGLVLYNVSKPKAIPKPKAKAQ